MQVGNLLKRGAGRRAVGATIGAAGLVFIGLGTAGVGTFKSTLATVVVADPGCTPSTAGPGTVTVCLKEAHEGFTASSFTGHSCDNIDNRDPALDYFVFVLPAAGDPGRVFTGTPSVTFDNGGTSVTANGTINSSNAKFFFASAMPGATLVEASSSANNGTGTPTGGEAQVFNLTHTCPATGTTTTTTSSTTTSSHATTTTSKTTTTTTTTSPTTTTTTSKTTTTTTTTSPTTTTTTSKTATTTTTTSPTTTTTTTTTSPTTTTTTSKTTTRTTTTSPTTTTTRTSRTTTRTTRTSPTTTTTSGASGNLSATTTSTTSSSGAGGVLATTTPSTGADTEFGAGLALLILGGGLAFSSTRLQRRKRQ